MFSLFCTADDWKVTVSRFPGPAYFFKKSKEIKRQKSHMAERIGNWLTYWLHGAWQSRDWLTASLHNLKTDQPVSDVPSHGAGYSWLQSRCARQAITASIVAINLPRPELKEIWTRPSFLKIWTISIATEFDGIFLIINFRANFHNEQVSDSLRGINFYTSRNHFQWMIEKIVVVLLPWSKFILF